MFVPVYSAHGSLYEFQGSFSPVAAGAGTTNQLLVPGTFVNPTPGAGNQNLGPNQQQNVSISTVSVYCNISASMPPAGILGLATNANSPNIYTLKFNTALTGQFCQMQADLLPGPASTSTIATSAPNTAAVLGFDNVNKLVYIGVVAQTSGNLTNSAVGDSIHFVITLCDNNSP